MFNEELLQLAMTLLVGLVGYFIAHKLKFPAPAMIGSMLAVGIYNSFSDQAFMPVSIKTLTQGVAGMFIGLRMSKEDFKNVRKLARPIALLCLIFTINTFVVGILISKICGIDILTSLLSCVAGGVTDISLISIDMGAETSIVALMHTIRLVSTLLIFPIWIAFFTKATKEEAGHEDKTIKSHSNDHRLIGNILSVMIAFLLGYLGSLTGIPAGSLIFSMFGVMVIHWYLPVIKCDRIVKTIGQLFAGSIIGATINKSTIMAIPTLFLPMLLLIGSYWLINIFYGKICEKRGLLDLKTAMFAACPAGASDMALIAADLGADLAKIGLIQALRLIYSVAVMPQLIMLFSYIFI